MKYALSLLISMFLFLGCATQTPKIKQEVVEKNVTQVAQEPEKELIDTDEIEEGNLIVNVFDDELYFEKDKVGKDKMSIVIKYLDAYAWEKEALKKVYKKYKRLWSKKQSNALRKIIEENAYYALCADGRYWDNLEFEQSEPERDILHSILLLRYLNNLSHGCPKWVESNGKVKNENRKEYVKTESILSLLPHDVIISRLISSFKPKNKKFNALIKKHKKLLSYDIKEEVLKESRLRVELSKQEACKPDYKRKRE